MSLTHFCSRCYYCYISSIFKIQIQCAKSMQSFHLIFVRFIGHFKCDQIYSYEIVNLQIFDNLLTDRDWEGRNPILLNPYTFFHFLNTMNFSFRLSKRRTKYFSFPYLWRNIQIVWSVTWWTIEFLQHVERIEIKRKLTIINIFYVAKHPSRCKTRCMFFMPVSLFSFRRKNDPFDPSLAMWCLDSNTG